MSGVEVLRKWVDECGNIVFFGGAGVSTESGIPDFRSVDGLYNQKYKYPPETILSYSFFIRNQAEFYEFYRDKIIFLDAEPNITHRKLAQLEADGKLGSHHAEHRRPASVPAAKSTGIAWLDPQELLYEMWQSIWR